ncbi:hypothetical protein [Pseudomonas costantinii]|uniref:hypothetical protein n=1 Tax=Pseudomonas costantinii TaxID=168469 RepID=UPI0015A07E9B|nr:hypothetical protein [Pseudomonas costantinii]NVZ72233.1 hypothetical protein [Pseudomonas costantinii]
MLNLTGSANITVTINGVTLTFPVITILGYYSWTRFNGASPNSIYIQHGSDLQAGSYDIDLSGKSVSYLDGNGNDCYTPTSGTLKLDVERLAFRTAFKHTGKLVNVTFGDQQPVVVLNGDYVVEYK